MKTYTLDDIKFVIEQMNRAHAFFHKLSDLFSCERCVNTRYVRIDMQLAQKKVGATSAYFSLVLSSVHINLRNNDNRNLFVFSKDGVKLSSKSSYLIR